MAGHTRHLIEIPLDVNNISLLFDDWLSKIIQDFFHITGEETRAREYSIIEYRFGLNGRTILTLDEIGILYDVSRERIRQIEKRALTNLGEIINTGVNEQRNVMLNSSFLKRIQRFRNSLNSLNKVVSEDAILIHTKEHFAEANINLHLLGLLLTLFGYEKIGLKTTVSDQTYAWALEPTKIKRIKTAMHAVFTYLRDLAIAKPYDEIKIAINKKRAARARFNDEEINLAIDLSFDIERLDDGTIQIRYDKLRSIADKAYRILHNTGEAIQSKQLAVTLNKEAFKHGQASRINAHNIGNRLSNDERFDSIGRNGGWILSDWQNYSTDYVLDLMEYSLHASGEPLTSQDIYDFVSARRPVSESAIDSYLGYDNRFVRVGTDLFALTDWGLTPVASNQAKTREKVIGKVKLCEYIELVFLSNETDEMFVTAVAQEISNLEPDISPQGIYNSILKSPAIKLVNRREGKRKRKAAIFDRNYRSKLTKLEILAKDTSVGELVQSTIRRLLEKQLNNQLELVKIRDLVSSEIHCAPASIYSAIENMNDIEKVRNGSNQIVCRLRTAAHEFSRKLTQINDQKLVTEINRALNLVNLDSIDLALFQLGKIFEYTLKRYMVEARDRDLFTVSRKDLEKLFNMIRWAGNVGLITDETALHFLRIERNDRGHGAPPDIDERQALLNNAPTLIKFYLDYIVLIEQRREKI
ncbi:MAG: hypothetical protein DWQ07_15125 [Chloroflexi bacterium]|nr:MAG: hypothetical protein DWQ07_15125 [Chloroflexota bacterium]MBL1196449.1 hypothetical protein [Chloroflexota bacterium]NOH13744.1 hypothetical protein [Chloroflexota bacterium]